MGVGRSGTERGVSRVALVLALSTITLGVASAAWAIQVATTARAIPDRTMRVVESPQAPIETATSSAEAAPRATSKHPKTTAAPSAAAARPSSKVGARATGQASKRRTSSPTPRPVLSASVSIGDAQDSQGNSNSADD